MVPPSLSPSFLVFLVICHFYSLLQKPFLVSSSWPPKEEKIAPPHKKYSYCKETVLFQIVENCWISTLQMRWNLKVCLTVSSCFGWQVTCLHLFPHLPEGEKSSLLFKLRKAGLFTPYNGSIIQTGFTRVKPVLAGAQWARYEDYSALAAFTLSTWALETWGIKIISFYISWKSLGPGTKPIDTS